MTTKKRKQTRLLPWFGSNTTNAQAVADRLSGCRWVGIPFGGGLCEVPFLTASTIVVNDLHRHVINLAQCIQHDGTRQWLIETLDKMPFHADVLKHGQQVCKELQPVDGLDRVLALWYFVSQWMGRSGKAGTVEEFNGNISIRANANGGDSNKRFRTAVESLTAWAAAMRQCNFSCLDWREWFKKYHGDTPAHGYYCDPPWPDLGNEYKHRFHEQDHRELALTLHDFEQARVVVRYGDHPLIRELYDEANWNWTEFTGRNQANKAVAEVLLTKKARTP